MVNKNTQKMVIRFDSKLDATDKQQADTTSQGSNLKVEIKFKFMNTN